MFTSMLSIAAVYFAVREWVSSRCRLYDCETLGSSTVFSSLPTLDLELVMFLELL